MMTKQQDIRWLQRFDNYKKVLKTLLSDIELATERKLSDIEKRGLIQSFEYTYELAWNTIRDFYKSVGDNNIQGSIDAFKAAFNRELVSNETLLLAVKSRQLTSHTYNIEITNKILNDIVNNYYDAFQELADNLQLQKENREQ